MDIRGSGLLPPGSSMPPWDMNAQSYYESVVAGGAHATIMHWGQAWPSEGGAFVTGLYDTALSWGAAPMVNWNPWQGAAIDPAWTDASIYNGAHDNYITQWATGAAAWGHPVFVRMMDEMNGRWYPWAEHQDAQGNWYNGNQPGDFIRAWRYIVTMFRNLGATNVQFVWCPNQVWSDADYTSTPLTELYPGDAYVDWVGMDAYNSAFSQGGLGIWLTPEQVFGTTYDQEQALAPTKPVMLGEFGTTAYVAPGVQDDNAKAQWLTEFFDLLPTRFPNIHAIVYFETDANEAVGGYVDWSVAAAGAASKAAYTNGILTLP